MPATGQPATLPPASTAPLGGQQAAASPLPSSSPTTHRRQHNHDVCIICFLAPITTWRTPCNHDHFCVDCAALDIAGAVHAEPQCPLCRQPVVANEPAPTELVQQQQQQQQQKQQHRTERPRASKLVDAFAYKVNRTRRVNQDLQQHCGTSTPWCYPPSYSMVA